MFESPSLGIRSRAALVSVRKSDRHVCLFFGGFSTVYHNRPALQGGAKDRFERTFLMVSRDEAIQ